MREGIYLEGLGGEIPFAGVSGKTGVGVSELLELIVLSADLHNISCDSEKPVEAIVIESSRDAKTGISATVIIKQGTLKVGGFAVAGGAFAPLRSLEDFTGKKVTEIACGKPARITGFTDEPKTGTVITTVATKKEAEDAEKNAKRNAENNERKNASDTGEKLPIRITIKADTAGSLEALEHEIAKIEHETAELLIAARGIGPISENDIKPLIGFSPALVIGFNVKCESNAKDLAERQHITLETRAIIYELADWLKETVEKLAPEKAEDLISGTAQILKHFSTSGSKKVVGGKVTVGTISRDDRIMIMRRGIEVGPGRITNLQMQKADVSSVPEGMEFGTQIDTKADIIAGDIISSVPSGKNK